MRAQAPDGGYSESNLDPYRSWYGATVVDAEPGRVKVHFHGWEDEEDEWADEAEGNNTQNPEPEPDAEGPDDQVAEADTADDTPDESDIEDGAVSQLEE